MCIACSALFRYILKEVRVCFSSSVYTKKSCSNLDFQTRIQPFSVQSLQEGFLEFAIFTTDTRILRVNIVWNWLKHIACTVGAEKLMEIFPGNCWCFDVFFYV